MAVIQYPNDSSSLILNGQAITDLAEGDFLTLTPVNPVTEHINSTGGGVSITKRLDGDVHDLVVRVQKMSSADIYLNSLAKGSNPAVINGTLRQAFTKDGTALSDSWALQNGSMTTRPTETRNNQTGNAVMEYGIRFRSAVRSI